MDSSAEAAVRNYNNKKSPRGTIPRLNGGVIIRFSCTKAKLTDF